LKDVGAMFVAPAGCDSFSIWYFCLLFMFLFESVLPCSWINTTIMAISEYNLISITVYPVEYSFLFVNGPVEYPPLYVNGPVE
jgi:hypothetical protein